MHSKNPFQNCKKVVKQYIRYYRQIVKIDITKIYQKRFTKRYLKIKEM